MDDCEMHSGTRYRLDYWQSWRTRRPCQLILEVLRLAPASVKCPDCGRKMTHIELVKGQTDQTRKCAPGSVRTLRRAESAPCACGGMNHGIAWKIGKALTAGKASSRHSLGR